jgi:uncharacterized protein YgiM (DUF1202 family)
LSAMAAPSQRTTYQVIGISESDSLNVREGAGSDYQVVTQLQPDERGIRLGTKRVTNGATTWQQVIVHGQTGWVNAAYIRSDTQAVTSTTQSSTAQ